MGSVEWADVFIPIDSGTWSQRKGCERHSRSRCPLHTIDEARSTRRHVGPSSCQGTLGEGDLSGTKDDSLDSLCHTVTTRCLLHDPRTNQGQEARVDVPESTRHPDMEHSMINETSTKTPERPNQRSSPDGDDRVMMKETHTLAVERYCHYRAQLSYTPTAYSRRSHSLYTSHSPHHLQAQATYSHSTARYSHSHCPLLSLLSHLFPLPGLFLHLEFHLYYLVCLLGLVLEILFDQV